MKFTSFFFSLLFCLFFVGNLVAQNPADRVKRRAENRAEQNVNNRVDRTVDKAVDDVIGSIFNKKQTKPADQNRGTANGDQAVDDDAAAQAATSEMLANLMGGGKWEAYTNPRNLSFSMEIVTTKSNGKKEQNMMDYAVTETEVGFRMLGETAPEETRMILNTQTGKTTMITTDKKGKVEGIRMRMPNIGALAQSQVEDEVEDYSNRVKINRTGERKTIDGYNCEKYVITDTQEGSTTTTWVTKDLNLSTEEMLKAMTGFVGGGKIKMPDVKQQPKGMWEGISIQTIFEDKKGEVTQMTYKNIKTDAATDKKILDVRGITIQDAGF